MGVFEQVVVCVSLDLEPKKEYELGGRTVLCEQWRRPDDESGSSGCRQATPATRITTLSRSRHRHRYQ